LQASCDHGRRCLIRGTPPRVDGEHAVWKVALLKPDLVVMDLAMPFLDGWEATRTINSHRTLGHTPIIVLTGHASEENLRRAHEVGADALVTKPCLPDALVADVRQLLSR
jgi:two-component system, cell cycle response regulator DivK